jgi:drug/metabolite transporter (DMT)-like permease
MAVLFGLFVIWSNSFHAIAYFRKDLGVSATALLTLRYGFVAPFCLAFCLYRIRPLRTLLARDGWKVLALGLLLVPCYNLALNWGQGRVPPATASLLISMNPVFTFLLAAAFLKERPGVTKLLGMCLSFLGIYLLISAQHRLFGGGYVPAALVVLIAPLAWAGATVMAKPMTRSTDPLLLSLASTGLGSLPFMFTLGLGTGGVHQVLGHLSTIGWIALIHLSALCTLLGFVLWFWALRRLPASTVASFVFLNPPLTSIFGVIWKTETFHWSTVVYGTVTLAGVALSSGLLPRPARASR